MKTFILSALICLGVSTASAILPLYDPFNYSVGADLVGQSPNAVDIWAATGTSGAGGTDPITIANGSLTVPGLAPSIGNSITYGGLGLTDRLSIGTPINTGTVFYSFAFSVLDLGGLNATGGFMAGFNTATGTQTGQPTQVGTRLLTRLSGSGCNIGVEKNSGMAANFIFDNAVRNVEETIFIVGSYNFNPGSGTDDQSFLWINPDPATFGLPVSPAPTLAAPIVGNDLTAVASFLFRQGNAAAVPGVVVADELRVDTTWAGVTPVPEPAALALVVLAGDGVMLARRWPSAHR